MLIAYLKNIESIRSMKNPHIQGLKLSAKRYHNTHSICLREAIAVPGGFNEVDAGVLSFYADVRFIMNDYQVHVSWRHPRCRYKEMADSLVSDVLLTAKPMPRVHFKADFEKIFGKRETLYKEVGRSRKKIAGYRFDRPELDKMLEQFEDMGPARSVMAMQADNGLIVLPFITSAWTKRHRFVRLCTPVEVETYDDVRELAQVARRLLSRVTTLDALYPGYRYTATDWIAEAPQRRSQDEQI
jgi:hypothetical protein